MIYKITYNEGNEINKVCEVEADSKAKAIVVFWLDHAAADDISKVEKVG